MGETGSAGGAYRQELSRSLTLPETVFLTLSSVSPAGSVFILAPVLIASLGGASVVAMMIAAAVAACVGMCYAELAATYPIAGGEYTWAARVLGRPVGFTLFLLTLAAGPAVGALLGAGAGEYFAVVWPALSSTSSGVAAILFATTIGDGRDLAPELTGTIDQIVTIRLVGIAGPHHRFEGHRLYQIVGHRGPAFVRPEHDFDLLD